MRGALVWLQDDPFFSDPAEALRHISDGVIVCRDGLIEAVGEASQVLGALNEPVEVDHYPGCLICPGFIDTHVHYVQTGIIGAYGDQLLDWLLDYAFPAELAFADPVYARAQAELFCDELLRNGTTTALVFCSVHEHSVDALFEAASRRNMRIAAGKVLMDRHAPEGLTDTAQTGYDQSKALIGRWHGNGRNLYAITPRFAATSTPEQLQAAGALWAEHPGVLVQTHIAENKAEIAWTAELFPDRRDYFDVYAHHGLAGPGAVFAHGVHLSEPELHACHATGSGLSHCPSSNLFLGSGAMRVFDVKDAERPVEVGLGTDVGAGTSLSMLRTLGDAYKVSQIAGRPLDAVRGLYLATLGGARAMGLADRIGSLAPGMEADFVVLDPAATSILKARNDRSSSLAETLFVLMALGDDRAVRQTWVAGKPCKPGA